jgi:multiple sugar transport system substrate-binding protein
MSKHNRRTYLRAVGALGAAGLAGCTGQDGTSDGGDGGDGSDGGDGGGSQDNGSDSSDGSGNGDTVVRMLSDRSARDIWESSIEEFNANSEYTVEVTWLPKGSTTNEQIEKMRGAGNLPEIVFETSTDAYRETVDGNTAPVTGLVENLETLDPVKHDGESYLLPAVTIPLAGVYREDVVEGDPRTREEWAQEAQRINEEEGMGGLVMPSGRTNNATTQVNQNLWNGGVNVYEGPSDDIRVTIDEGENRERAVETYAWMQEMAEYNPNTSGWEWGDVANALIQEQAAAALTIGGLMILQVQADRPDLADKLRATPFPLAEGVDQGHWWAYTEGFYLHDEAPNLDGAREYLEFFMSSDYYLDFIMETPLFNFPTSLDQVQSDTYQGNELVQAHQDLVDLVVDNWEYMRPVLATGDDGAPNLVAANAYGQQLMGQSADQLIAGGLSPEETVDWVAEELRSLQE